jgi:hypothetical protein
MQITCDRCNQPFEVDNAQPGQKVACPACGDVAVIPGAVVTGRPVAPDRAAAAGYPPANGPEVDVLMVRPAMLRAHPFRFIILFIVGVGGMMAGVHLWLISNPPKTPVAIGCFALGAVALGMLGVWKVHTLSEGLRITTKRTVEIKGLLSKATSEVLHADIRNIQVEQTFFERVCNVGFLSLSSSAENQDVVEMSDVPDPGKVKSIIDLYRPM